MEKNDSRKLLDHIDEAKDWLDKAKDEYNQANPIGGELILNLAGAEVKYAWELSHSRCVVNQKKLSSNRKFKIILPVAASIIVLFGLVFWLKSGGFYNDEGSRLTSVKKDKPVVLQEISINKKNKINSNQNIVTTNNNQTLVAADKSLVDAPLKTKSQTVNHSSDVERNSGKNRNTAPANQRRVSGQTSVQPNIQPVAQFSIDEEALTKEASRSLRNGK